MKFKLGGTAAGSLPSILKHVAEAFPPPRQESILNNHEIITIATNTQVVLNCFLVTYQMMTAEVGLPDAI